MRKIRKAELDFRTRNLDMIEKDIRAEKEARAKAEQNKKRGLSLEEFKERFGK